MARRPRHPRRGRPRATTHTACAGSASSRRPEEEPASGSASARRRRSASATRISPSIVPRYPRGFEFPRVPNLPGFRTHVKVEVAQRLRALAAPATPRAPSRVAPSGAPMSAKSSPSSSAGSSARRSSVAECASVHQSGVMPARASRTNRRRYARAAAPSGSSTKRPLLRFLYANASSSAKRHASSTARNARPEWTPTTRTTTPSPGTTRAPPRRARGRDPPDPPDPPDPQTLQTLQTLQTCVRRSLRGCSLAQRRRLRPEGTASNGVDAAAAGRVRERRASPRIGPHWAEVRTAPTHRNSSAAGECEPGGLQKITRTLVSLATSSRRRVAIRSIRSYRRAFSFEFPTNGSARTWRARASSSCDSLETRFFKTVLSSVAESVSRRERRAVQVGRRSRPAFGREPGTEPTRASR